MVAVRIAWHYDDVTVDRERHAPIVLLSWLSTRDPVALLRATALALTEDRPLHAVLCERDARDRREAARESARAWVERRAPAAHVSFGGRTLERAAQAALVDAPALFVIPWADLDGPREAIEVAARTAVPVLVARSPSARSTLLAASNFEDEALPVVTSACRFAQWTQASVVAVHNAEVLTVQPLSPHGAPRVVGAADADEHVHSVGERFADAVERVSISTEPVICTETSSSEAVLRIAERLRPDLVVVGARRGWMRRWFGRGTAEAVVRDARTSVLVTPLPG